MWCQEHGVSQPHSTLWASPIQTQQVVPQLKTCVQVFLKAFRPDCIAFSLNHAIAYFRLGETFPVFLRYFIFSQTKNGRQRAFYLRRTYKPGFSPGRSRVDDVHKRAALLEAAIRLVLHLSCSLASEQVVTSPLAARKA